MRKVTYILKNQLCVNVTAATTGSGAAGTTGPVLPALDATGTPTDTHQVTTVEASGGVVSGYLGGDVIGYDNTTEISRGTVSVLHSTDVTDAHALRVPVTTSCTQCRY